jgi:hypothetical protein
MKFFLWGISLLFIGNGAENYKAYGLVNGPIHQVKFLRKIIQCGN